MIIRLDSTNPQLIDIAEETLGMRHLVFSSRESLLMSAFSLPIAPHKFTLMIRCYRDAPLPLRLAAKSPPSVNFLVPIILGAKPPSRQRRDYSGELLRTL